MADICSLAEMHTGETGKIVGLRGGQGLLKNLEGMGIRTGSRIKKVSGQIMRGPVIVSCGNTQVAIGFGMAKKIIHPKIPT